MTSSLENSQKAKKKKKKENVINSHHQKIYNQEESTINKAFAPKEYEASPSPQWLRREERWEQAIVI